MRMSRRIAFTTASVTALMLGQQPLMAQTADDLPPTVAQADMTTEDKSPIIVTGSRITRDGYSAPTPVSMLTEDDIQAQSPANISNFVSQLPAIQGSSAAATTTSSLSAGTAGIASVNLRSLGANRTLVLLDGQRSVASSATGLVDINTFPQALIERVEVVTGGASAAYGSDAVGGVVNFILKKDFKGLQLNADYGETTYGDGANYNFSATAGAMLMDDRLHVMGNVNYFNQEHIPFIDRDWNNSGYNVIPNPAYVAGNGQPEFVVASQTGPNRVTPGGLVVSGPLRGTKFGLVNPNTGFASVGQHVFGQSQTANAIAMQGGDWQEAGRGFVGSTSLEPGQERIGAYGRVSFEISPNVNVFASMSYNKMKLESNYLQPINNGNLTIRRDNAYLPASVGQQMNTLGLTSITIGTTNEGLPIGGAENERAVYRYVIGGKGSFDLMNRDWNWDIYYQRGISRVNELLYGTWRTSRINDATDAVFAPAGNSAGIPAGKIVCRTTLTAPTNGCIPLNRIGSNGQSQAAIDYILNDGAQPARFQRLQQDVAAVTLSGELFDLPGGPAAIALGGEWRQEKIEGEVDPQFNTGWQYGNYLENNGKYNVKEAFAELSLPVFTGAEINGAGRVTDYSTSGVVATWKVGATWQPIDDIRFRGNISRDIRAPNLDELFAAGTGRSNTILLRESGQPTRTVGYQQKATGNPNVKPEVASSWTVGAVLTPTFMPEFAFSVDLYRVKISGAIGSLAPQNIVDLCFINNDQSQCNNLKIARDISGRITNFDEILLFPINFASQVNKGIDFETSYRTSLDRISSSLDGQLTLKASATHYISNRIDDTLNLPSQTVGQFSNSQFSTSGPPAWNYRLSAIYNSQRVTTALIGRGYTSGVLDNNAIICSTNCPASTTNNRTINTNFVGGAFFLDASLAYRIPVGNSETQIQLTVNNLLNRDPTLTPNGPTGDSQFSRGQASLSVGDRLGRTFRLSARFKY
jgi:outer membrane receptor protein involved in Fe transport